MGGMKSISKNFGKFPKTFWVEISLFCFYYHLATFFLVILYFLHIIKLYGLSKCHFLKRSNVLIVLLEYIDLFQSEGQHETNIWEGLPCPLPFYIAVFHYKHIAIVTN